MKAESHLGDLNRPPQPSAPFLAGNQFRTLHATDIVATAANAAKGKTKEGLLPVWSDPVLLSGPTLEDSGSFFRVDRNRKPVALRSDRQQLNMLQYYNLDSRCKELFSEPS